MSLLISSHGADALKASALQRARLKESIETGTHRGATPREPLLKEKTNQTPGWPDRKAEKRRAEVEQDYTSVFEQEEKQASGELQAGHRRFFVVVLDRFNDFRNTNTRTFFFFYTRTNITGVRSKANLGRHRCKYDC